MTSDRHHALVRRTAIPALALWSCLLGLRLHAEADGPDFYQVTDLPDTGVLLVRSEPGPSETEIATLPSGTDGLRNLGCRGGLTFAEYQQATPEEREAGKLTRWCRIEHGDVTGWVAGRFLAEGGPGSGAPAKPPAEPAEGIRTVALSPDQVDGSLGFEGRMEGRAVVDYVVAGSAGERLEVTLERTSRFLFFNVMPPGDGAALFAGAGAIEPERWSGVLPEDGSYTIRLFLMPNAARRSEESSYALRFHMTCRKTE